MPGELTDDWLNIDLKIEPIGMLIIKHTSCLPYLAWLVVCWRGARLRTKIGSLFVVMSAVHTLDTASGQVLRYLGSTPLDLHLCRLITRYVQLHPLFFALGLFQVSAPCAVSGLLLMLLQVVDLVVYVGASVSIESIDYYAEVELL